MVFEDVTQSVRGFDEFTGKRNCVSGHVVDSHVDI